MGADAQVIHPPVDCSRFTLPDGKPAGDDYYVLLGAFAPYKRVDLAIEAFQRMGKRLLVGGGGLEATKLEKLLTPGSSVQLVGEVAPEKLASFLGGARAFIFPGEEDFGIAPVEAQACGVPVIAFGRGGALETVRGLNEAHHPTGLFFREQSVDALIEAVERFERHADAFDPRKIRAHALTFDRPRFQEALRAAAEQAFGASLFAA